MKRKVYSFFMIALLAMVSLAVNAQKNVTIKVNDPSKLEVAYGYSAYSKTAFTLTAGENAVTIPNYRSLLIFPNDGVTYSVTKNGASIGANDLTTSYTRQYDNITEGDVYEITVAGASGPETDATFTINIDNPDNVYVGSAEYSKSFGTLVAGDNTINFKSGEVNAIYVRDETYTSGKTFTTVTLNDVALTKYESGMAFYKIEQTIKDGDVLKIVTGNSGTTPEPTPEVTTGTLKVNVDDASHVGVYSLDSYGNTTSLGTLVNGENSFTFNVGELKTVVVKDPNWALSSFASVKYNNTEVSKESGYSYAYYKITGSNDGAFADGDVIDVTVTSAAKPKATFTFTNEGMTAVTYLKIGSTLYRTDQSSDTEHYNAVIPASIEFNAGDYIDLRINNTAYDVTFTANGETVASGNYYKAVSEDIAFSIDAQKWVDYSFSINIDTPANVSVYKYANASSTNLISLAAGDNTVTVNGNVKKISVVPVTENSKVTQLTIKKNGTAVCTSSTETQEITVAANDQIVITTASVDVCTVNVDNASKVKMLDSNRNEITLNNGANTSIPAGTYLIQNSSNVSGYTLCGIKKNNETVNKPYASAAYWQVTLAAGDVLDITADWTPASSNVTFSGCTAAVTSVQHSGASSAQISGNPGTEAISMANGYKTYVTLNTTDYKVVSVKVNGTAASGYNGSYSFAVTADATVEIDAHEWTNYDVPVTGNTDAVTFYQSGNSGDWSPQTVCTVADGKINVSEKTPYVYIKANEGYDISEVKHGETTISKNNNNYYVMQTTSASTITFTAAKQVVEDETAPTTDEEVATAVAKRWKSGFFKFNAEVPANLKVYAVTNVADDVITLEEQSSIVAWTPYIMKVTGEYSLSGEYVVADQSQFGTAGLNSGTVCGGEYLKGAVSTVAIQSGAYVLQKQDADSEATFHVLDGTTVATIPVGKCFLNYTSNNGAKSLSFKYFEDGATKIESVNAAELNNNTVMYNLAGQRVKSAKGIVIINGKKVIK